MSEEAKSAIDALAKLPQERREEALNGMAYLAMGYQMGHSDGLKEAGKENKK